MPLSLGGGGAGALLPPGLLAGGAGGAAFALTAATVPATPRTPPFECRPLLLGGSGTGRVVGGAGGGRGFGVSS